jgi:hypothetical protein
LHDPLEEKAMESKTTVKLKQESEAYWLKHVAQFADSKQSCVGYCREHDINYHRFKYWQKKYKQAPPKKLIPVTIKSSPATMVEPVIYCELKLRNGAKVEITTKLAYQLFLEQVLS